MENRKKQNETASVNKNVIETITIDNEVPDIVPGFKTMDDFLQAGFRAAMEVTKLANRLPTGHKWDIYSSYPSFHRIMDDEANQMQRIMSMILKHQGIGANVMRRDVEEKFDLVVEANDSILERVGFNLDELAGIRRNPEPVLVEATITRPVTAPWNQSEANSKPGPSSAAVVGSGQTLRLLTARNIERPQAKFKHKIDNSPNPFEPVIKYKPNGLTPLAITIEVSDDGERFCHPYEFELDRLQVPPAQLERVSQPTLPQKPTDTPLVVVERPEDIHIMLEDLRHYTEVAVDLEHHSYRTYQGLTCLMQLSTRDTDYIIDTLALRSDLQCLNDIFTSTKVVKVLHGADSDVVWLQRDLGLYLVNMFDTHQAARLLGLAHLSLAFLLKHYCQVSANKQYQLADWRIRPLPEELVNYAREDTHYLLYIYDVMKNELLDRANGKTNLLLSVIQRSTEICKKRYEKLVITEDSHKELYRRHKKLFDNRQMHALRELFCWRDKIARQEDESTGFVLPNHMLLQIAETLPREMQGVLACCNPIPPLVRQHLNALHQLILKARDQPLVRPVVEEERHARPAAQTQFLKTNLESPLLCPHDLSHAADFRDDLPCLLDGRADEAIAARDSELAAAAPTITVFADTESCGDGQDEGEDIPARLRQIRFVSPYTRYLRAQKETEAGAPTDDRSGRSNETVGVKRLKRESTSDYDEPQDISDLDSSAAADTSTFVDSSYLKREVSPEADAEPKKKKHQQTPKERSFSDTNDNEGWLPDYCAEEKKAKKRKKKRERVEQQGEGTSSVADQDNADSAVGSQARDMQVASDGRLSAGHKHPRSDAVAGPLSEPTPPKVAKLDAPGTSKQTNQMGLVGPLHSSTPKFKNKRQAKKNKKKLLSGMQTPEEAGVRGPAVAQGDRDGTALDRGGQWQQSSTGSASGHGPDAAGRGGGVPGRSRGGRGRGTAGQTAGGRGRGPADDTPFRPFDYSEVDFRGRFRGGSGKLGPVRGGAPWKDFKGKRGKAQFAGKLNKKSMTSAKKFV